MRCITSDLGTEVGIADILARDARSLLTEWLDCTFLQLDVEDPSAFEHILVAAGGCIDCGANGYQIT
jgi:hypothetical protein